MNLQLQCWLIFYGLHRFVSESFVESSVLTQLQFDGFEILAHRRVRLRRIAHQSLIASIRDPEN